MEEQVFFEYDGVRITNARFVADGQTYAMSNITSVKAQEESPSRIGGLVALLLGLGMAASPDSRVGGILIALVAAYYLYKQKRSIT